MPRARIMTFGYSAMPAFENTTAGIEEHGKDLLRSLTALREGIEVRVRMVLAFPCNCAADLRSRRGSGLWCL